MIYLKSQSFHDIKIDEKEYRKRKTITNRILIYCRRRYVACDLFGIMHCMHQSITEIQILCDSSMAVLFLYNTLSLTAQRFSYAGSKIVKNI